MNINTHSDDWRAVEAYLEAQLKKAMDLLTSVEDHSRVLKLQERIRVLKELQALPSVSRPANVAPLGFETM